MNPSRGELYWMSFGIDKKRPVVVVSRDKLNQGSSVVVVPFTTQKIAQRRRFKNCVHFHAEDGGLPQECVAQADSITLVDKAEIDVTEKIGRLSEEQMQKIVEAIRYAIRDGDL